MTTNLPQPFQPPNSSPPPPRRSPEEWARLTGSCVRAGTHMLVWSLVAVCSIGMAIVVIRWVFGAVWRATQVASRVFAQ